MKKIILLLLLALPANAWCMSKSDIRDQIRLLVRDNDTTNRRWTDVQLETRINMGELEFAKRSRAIKATYLITTTTLTATYALPSDWLSSDRVSYAILPLTSATTNYRILEYWTIAGMDEKQPGWENSQQSYPSRYMYYDDDIILWPPPSTTYAGADYLKVDYSVRPSTMTDDTDVPYNEKTNLYPYHSAIVWYVLSLCYSDTGQKDLELFYWTKFLQEIETAKDEINNRPDKKGGFAPK